MTFGQKKEKKKPKYPYVSVYPSSGGRKYWTKYISQCEGIHFCAEPNIFHLTYMPVTIANIIKCTKDRVERIG